MDFLHLFILVGFAFAQPVYDLLGQNPEFFVSHKASPGLIFVLVFVLSTGVALSFVLLELLMALIGERIRRGLHWVVVFCLVALIMLPPAKRLLGENYVLIMGIAMLTSLFFTILYARWKGMRLFVTMLSPAVVVFPLWFLAGTPVSRLVMPDAVVAQADVEIQNPVPVVLVVLDEFNITALLDAEGRIDPVRFPNFAALAAECWWFPNAVATSVWTERAVPAILTGRQPISDVRLNPTATDFPQNLFTILGQHYHLNVFESLTMLCPDALCRQEGDAVTSNYQSFFADVGVIFLHIIMPSQFGQKLPSLDARWMGFGRGLIGGVGLKEERFVGQRKHTVMAHDRDSYLTSFLSNIQIQENSYMSLHFIHVLLPHVTYEYLASGHKYFPSDGGQFLSGILNEAGGWIGEEPLILTAYYRYLQQIGYLDLFLGKLKQKLEESRLYNDALIILTADHGVAFQRGSSRREVEEGNERDILRVPMFVKLPGQREGRISERLVSGIDVLPTIVDILGIRPPEKMDGYSMVSGEEPPRKEIEIPNVGHFSAADLEGFPRLKWQVDHFGEHTSLDRLVPQGPYPTLIGQPLNKLSVGRSSELKFKSEDLEYLDHVKPESGFLPALLRGHISSIDNKNLPIAIALNGRIWATTNTSEWERKKNYFSVLLPPAAFKEGENIVKIYRIEKTGKKLSPIEWENERPKVRLQKKRSGSIELIYSNSRTIPINGERGIIQGALDSVRLIGNMLVFIGWGADIKANKPAAEVLIFVGEQLVSRVIPGSSRQDVADVLQQPALLRSGFDAIVPVEILKSLAGEIRVILISEEDRTLQLSLNEDKEKVIRATLKEGVISE